MSITILVPFRVQCDVYGCLVTAMGTCAQNECCTEPGPAVLWMTHEPALPEGWTRTQWGAHRCPGHKEIP